MVACYIIDIANALFFCQASETQMRAEISRMREELARCQRGAQERVSQVRECSGMHAYQLAIIEP